MYIMFLIPFLMCGPVLVCGETHRPIDKQPQLAFFFLDLHMSLINIMHWSSNRLPSIKWRSNMILNNQFSKSLSLYNLGPQCISCFLILIKLGREWFYQVDAVKNDSRCKLLFFEFEFKMLEFLFYT